MFSTLFSVTLFLAPVFAGFAINSPVLTQCKSSSISWEHTKGPYNLIVVPAADPCGATPYYELDTGKSKIDWVANIPAGTRVVLSVIDSEDGEAWSRNITVAKSDDDSCLKKSTPSASLVPSSVPSGSPEDSEPSEGPSVPSGVIVDPIGAANAGSNDLFNKDDGSAAPAALQLGRPVMALVAVGAALAMAL